MQPMLELSLSPAQRQIAELLRARRWREAAEALAAIERRTSQAEFRLRLARNMAAMEEWRPEIYRVLMDALVGGEEQYAITRGKWGRWTVDLQSGSDRQVDPISATMQTLTEVKPAWQGGKALAVCGLGDGYLLSALANFSPSLPLGRQQAVYLLEPRAELVLTLLMLHDYSQADGPILQKRFSWAVGADWGRQFRQFFDGNPAVVFPESQIGQGTDVAQIDSQIRKTLNELVEKDRELAKRVEAAYAGVSARDLAAVFGANPPRRPRILLMTSRFTTVLQYSTADAAAAFAALGWETLTMIEPEPFHALRKSAMRHALADFRPDLVLIIDHLRHEYDGVFPANLPFACWIQDHLPPLCNARAGESVRARDFVLTAIGAHFVNKHQYPARQIVDLPNLARIPKRPATWKSDGLDLVYISNWTRTTEQVIEEVLIRAGQPADLRAIAEVAISRILGVYERGGCLATQREVRAELEAAQLELGRAIADAELADSIVNLLWDRLNNHLYRHQALGWAAEIADRRGLSFGLYGRGWETHPGLNRFARGVVKPGEDLENLVRKSRINLQLEPFACFTHPRLLNGLFAGGFFLIRDHPFNHLPQRMLDFLVANVSGEVETVEEVRGALEGERLAEFEALLKRCEAMGEQADPVQMTRNWERAGLISGGGLVTGLLGEIIFSSPDGLERNVTRFAADEGLRGRVASGLRQELEGRLSYEAGIGRAIARIEKLLRAES
jgi:hypothetical protein